MSIAAILALLQTAQAVADTKLVKDLLGFFVKRGDLTPEQSQVLLSHHEDYQRRIAARS